MWQLVWAWWMQCDEKWLKCDKKRKGHNKSTQLICWPWVSRWPPVLRHHLAAHLLPSQRLLWWLLSPSPLTCSQLAVLPLYRQLYQWLTVPRPPDYFADSSITSNTWPTGRPAKVEKICDWIDIIALVCNNSHKNVKYQHRLSFTFLFLYEFHSYFFFLTFSWVFLNFYSTQGMTEASNVKHKTQKTKEKLKNTFLMDANSFFFILSLNLVQTKYTICNNTIQ